MPTTDYVPRQTCFPQEMRLQREEAKNKSEYKKVPRTIKCRNLLLYSENYLPTV